MEQNWFILVSSLTSLVVGAILTFTVQSKVLENTRKFQLKDKAIENRNSVLLNRVEVIEKLVTEIFFCFKDILSLGVKFQCGEIHPQVISDMVASLQNKIQYINAMSSVLNSTELNRRIFMFESKFVDFNKAVNNMLDQKNMEDLGLSYSQIQIPFMEVIKQLDTIRIDLLNNGPA